jgi:hypothetical protein
LVGSTAQQMLGLFSFSSAIGIDPPPVISAKAGTIL